MLKWNWPNKNKLNLPVKNGFKGKQRHLLIYTIPIEEKLFCNRYKLVYESGTTKYGPKYTPCR